MKPIEFALPDATEPEVSSSPARCEVCGRFAKNVRLVWSGGPEPEPDYVVGNCCEDAIRVEGGRG